MRHGLDRSVLIGIALLCALIIGVAVSSYLNVLQIRADANLSSHSRDVIDAVAEVRSETRRLQASQRSYLINGLETALAGYRKAEESLGTSMAKLMALTEGDAEQSRRARDAAGDIDSGVGNLNEMVILRREKGLGPVQEIGAARAGRSFVEPLLESLAGMEQTERDRLNRRDRDTAEAYSRALSFSVAGAIIGLGGLGLFVFLLSRHAQAQSRTAARLSEQQELMSATLASIGDAVITTDKDARVTFLNGVAEDLTGWSQADADGRPLTDVFHIVNETTRGPVENPALRALADGQIVGLANHTILIARDGTERPIDDSAAPIRSRGEVSGAVLVFRDISDRKAVEADLARAHAETARQKRLYETILSATPDFVYVFSLDHKVLYANESLIAMWGRGREGAIGKTFLEIGYPAWHAEMHDREIDQVRVTKRPIRGEVPFHGTLGRRVYDYIFVPVLDSEGVVEAVAGTTRDVTERKAGEEKLRLLDAVGEAVRPAADPVTVMAETTRLLGEHLEATRVAYADLEPDNDRFTIRHDWVTLGAASTVGTYSLDTFGPRAAATLRAGRTFVVRDVDAELTPADGGDTFNAIGIKAIVCCPLVKDGRLVAMMAAHQSVPRDWNPGELALVEEVVERSWAHVERVGSAAAVRASDERFRIVARATNDAVWDWDMRNNEVWWNEGVTTLFGHRREDVGKDAVWWSAQIHPDDRLRVVTGIHAVIDHGGSNWSDEYRFQRADGTYATVLDRGYAIHEDGKTVRLVGAMQDVTERRRVETESREIRSRLEATLSAAEVATWTWDIPSDRVVADRNLARLFGVTDADAQGGPVGNFLHAIHPDDRAGIEDQIRAVLATGDSLESRYRVRHADGTYHTVIARGRVERDENGTPTRLPGVVLDISRQVESEKELRKSEEQRRLALDAAELGAWNIDPATNTLTSDDRFRIIFTGSTAPLTYEEAFAAIHPDDVKKVRDGVAAATRTDDPAPYAEEYRVVHRDGTVRWVFAKGRANLETVNGLRLLVSFDGTVMDTTNRMLADQALRAGEERLRMALAVARMVAWEWTPTDRKMRVSENAADVFGLHPGVGLTGIDQGLALVHPDDVDHYQDTFRKAIDERRSYLTQYRLVRPLDNRVIWIEEQGHTVFDQPGDAVRLYGVAADVTARREAENSLRASEEKYRTLFETMDEGFCVVEVMFDERGKAFDYRFREVNRAFERHCGLVAPVGKTIREMVPDHDSHWFETYGRVAVTGEPARFEDRGEAMGGWWWDVYAFRLGGSDSRTVAVLFNDITVRKKAEDELRQLAADLSEAGRRKDEFLAILAHELRNPLAPIRNGLTVLRTGKEKADLDRVVGMMDRQVNQLVHLVDDLLDVSRVTTGKVTLRPERVLLSTLVESAVETSRPLIEQARHEMTLSLPADPVYVDADPTRFIQILTNLLNNAAKYTPPGGRIDVSAFRDGDTAVIRVKDTGVGIPRDMLAKVFDMFMQVGTSLERSQGGLGLGLTLVRKLTEMHGGTVTAESQGENQGSTFVVRVPEAPTPSGHKTVMPDSSGSSLPVSRRVLVVDDNIDGAESLAMLLEMTGYEVRTAHNGLDGLAAAKAFLPDIILLDIGLPGLNGYEVAKRIRQEPNFAGVALVALTGWGSEEDRKQAKEAGFDHHLTKPVESTRLSELLAQVKEKSLGTL